MIHPLTPLCNQKCIFCSAYGRSDKDFNLKSFISEIEKDEDKLIILSGGEPFIVGIDNLIYIADFVSKKNKTLEIQTNATLLKNMDFKKLKILVSIINKTNGYFNINFSSHSKELDFKITRVKEAFKKRIEGLNILDKLGATIRITYVVNSLNYKYLPSFSKFVIKKLSFVSWVQFSFVKGIGRADKNRKIIPKYSLVSPYLIKAFEFLESSGIYFEVDHIPLCFLGKYYERNVDVEKIRKGIKGEYLKEKSKLLRCRDCKFYNICPGPRKDYIEIYKRL